MQFAIGTIKRDYGRYHEVILYVEGEPFCFNIGNYLENSHLIDEATHGLFRFVPEDQFAYFIPMSEVNVMLTQAYEQARLARMERNRNEAQNVVDASV